jgi:hypothetical protein
MRTVNALTMPDLGSILEELEKNKEPIPVSKWRRARAGLTVYDACHAAPAEELGAGWQPLAASLPTRSGGDAG